MSLEVQTDSESLVFHPDGYTWEDHQDKLTDALVYGLPEGSGWRLDKALLVAPPDGFRYLVSRLSDMQESSLFRPEGNFLERLAEEAYWELTREDLDDANRRGAAWADIVYGTLTHGYRLMDDRARYTMWQAQSGLFDPITSPTDMVTFLQRNYASPSGLARQSVLSKVHDVLKAQAAARRAADSAYRPPTIKTGMRKNGRRRRNIPQRWRAAVRMSNAAAA